MDGCQKGKEHDNHSESVSTTMQTIGIDDHCDFWKSEYRCKYIFKKQMTDFFFFFYWHTLSDQIGLQIKRTSWPSYTTETNDQISDKIKDRKRKTVDLTIFSRSWDDRPCYNINISLWIFPPPLVRMCLCHPAVAKTLATRTLNLAFCVIMVPKGEKKFLLAKSSEVRIIHSWQTWSYEFIRIRNFMLTVTIHRTCLLV